ncbi:MAG: 23S rRNA pseudouridine synthase F [Parcubacteria group bacterium CG10_big_fil_rev_8_21_14_0_10_36_14]|nr:MAG: 23S rRNA pseudouridine synthase F [Parcubacteria group bacterium CG10_big_fil_rev_8_21_14_0_10_36_14]
MRINKYIALFGDFSRREADRLIEDGRVLIDGEKAELGDKVASNSEVFVNGKKIAGKEYASLAYNKPKDIVTSSPHRGQKSIADIFDYPVRVHPIGRLDKNSHGLILLTNDPRLTNKILGWEKEYEVEVDNQITQDFLDKMKVGVIISTEKGYYKTKPVSIKKISSKIFSIILKEGKKRQIRLMCRALGYRVCDLKRVRIGKIKLDGLGINEYKKIAL